MSGSERSDVMQLLRSFDGAFGRQRVLELESLVEHGETPIAVEILSSWIYEENVAVTAAQEAAILKVSADCGVDAECHAFIGRTPPYPDLRTPGMIALDERGVRLDLEGVRSPAKANQVLLAVRKYREITGAGLEEAVAAVEQMHAAPD